MNSVFGPGLRRPKWPQGPKGLLLALGRGLGKCKLGLHKQRSQNVGLMWCGSHRPRSDRYLTEAPISIGLLLHLGVDMIMPMGTCVYTKKRGCVHVYG